MVIVKIIQKLMMIQKGIIKGGLEGKVAHSLLWC